MRSALPSGKPTNRSGEALEPPRDAGRGSFEGGKEVIKRDRGRLSPP
jgi:hypothetical protein